MNLIIDLHLHTGKYSSCSNINLESGLKKAKNIGLDGICITDHDSYGIKKEKDYLKFLEKKYDIKIFVGAEILTNKGDVLVFGLNQLPRKYIKVTKLLEMVTKEDAVSIGAHPYRFFNGFNRALGDNIKKLNLTAVEVYNGNTILENNMKAYNIAKKNNFKMTGGSDAHNVKDIGKYATYFSKKIRDINDLIDSLQKRDYSPVQYKDGEYCFVEHEASLF